MESKIKQILGKIQTFLSAEVLEDNQTEVKLESQTLKDGTLIEYDVWEAGASVFIAPTEEGQDKIPLPVGEYELEDGKILVVSEEGIIGEVKEPEAEEEVAEETSEDSTEEEQEMSLEDFKKLVASLSKEKEEALELLQEAKEELSKQLEEPKEEVKEEVKLSEETEDITSKREVKETILNKHTQKVPRQNTRNRIYEILNNK